MINKSVTITSKRQITLPVSFTKKLKLQQGRVLNATIQGDKIILATSENLSDKMKSYWKQKNKNVALSDEELKKAIRQAAVKRLVK